MNIDVIVGPPCAERCCPVEVKWRPLANVCWLEVPLRKPRVQVRMMGLGLDLDRETAIEWVGTSQSRATRNCVVSNATTLAFRWAEASSNGSILSLRVKQRYRGLGSWLIQELEPMPVMVSGAVRCNEFVRCGLGNKARRRRWSTEKLLSNGPVHTNRDKVIVPDKGCVDDAHIGCWLFAKQYSGTTMFERMGWLALLVTTYEILMKKVGPLPTGHDTCDASVAPSAPTWSAGGPDCAVGSGGSDRQNWNYLLNRLPDCADVRMYLTSGHP
ncbi:hypothetical protein PIB30_015676 [Stylosanthes scabra]|uniref:Uncharacterized protein n=1 Tax=Stylosanthes scabra TaxID=79078 RepID=A0ABU6U5W5_9FABA|nr:hypothetical protein [Stylosanthes scabra]